MHARVLDVLADGVVEHLAVVRDRVDLDLLGALDELGDDDRVVARDLGRAGEVAPSPTLLILRPESRACLTVTPGSGVRGGAPGWR